MTKVFVLGNGESRKNINLNALKTKGKVYGCNGLYRDFVADTLVVVDGGMMHEVYSSGYPLENQCYFRGWNRLPDFMYSEMVNLEDYLDWPEGILVENEKGSKTEFVMNGTDPRQMERLYNHYKSLGSDDATVEKLLTQHHQWITWVEDTDKVESIPVSFEGWSAGPIAVRIALDKEAPSEVYLLGFDLTSNDGKINNVYKDTENYLTSDCDATPHTKWVMQHAVNFKDFPHVKFYKVNSEELNFEVSEWSEFENVKYVLQKDIDIPLL